MPIIQKTLLLVISWFFCWVFLGTGIKLYKQYKYEAASIGFVSAFAIALYMFRLIILMR